MDVRFTRDRLPLHWLGVRPGMTVRAVTYESEPHRLKLELEEPPPTLPSSDGDVERAMAGLRRLFEYPVRIDVVATRCGEAEPLYEAGPVPGAMF